MNKKSIIKFTSILVLICFASNSTISGNAFGLPAGNASSAATLAVASRYSPLLGEEHKDIGMAMTFLQAELKVLMPEKEKDRIPKTLEGFKRRMKEERKDSPRDAIGHPTNPALVQLFFREAEKFDFDENNKVDEICVRCRFRKQPKRKDENGVKDYFLVFSLKPENGFFPVKGFFTEEEYAKAIEGQDEKRALLEAELPVRTEDDLRAIDRYVRHAGSMDKVIKQAFKDGRVISFPAKSSARAKINSNIRKRLREMHVDVKPSYDREKVKQMKDIEARDINFILLDKYAEETLRNDPVVIIDESGEEHTIAMPRGHASDHAIHIFVTQKEYSKIYNHGASHLFTDMGDGLTRTLVHEIGVMCGLPVLSVAEGRVFNELDLILEGYSAGIKPADGEQKTYALVDLDEQTAMRDYAAGEVKKTKIKGSQWDIESLVKELVKIANQSRGEANEAAENRKSLINEKKKMEDTASTEDIREALFDVRNAGKRTQPEKSEVAKQLTDTSKIRAATRQLNKTTFGEVLAVAIAFLGMNDSDQFDEAPPAVRPELAGLVAAGFVKDQTSTDTRYYKTQRKTLSERLKNAAILMDAHAATDPPEQSRIRLIKIISHAALLLRSQEWNDAVDSAGQLKQNAYKYLKQTLEDVSPGTVQHTIALAALYLAAQRNIGERLDMDEGEMKRMLINIIQEDKPPAEKKDEKETEEEKRQRELSKIIALAVMIWPFTKEKEWHAKETDIRSKILERMETIETILSQRLSKAVEVDSKDGPKIKETGIESIVHRVSGLLNEQKEGTKQYEQRNKEFLAWYDVMQAYSGALREVRLIIEKIKGKEEFNISDIQGLMYDIDDREHGVRNMLSLIETSTEGIGKMEAEYIAMSLQWVDKTRELANQMSQEERQGETFKRQREKHQKNEEALRKKAEWAQGQSRDIVADKEACEQSIELVMNNIGELQDIKREKQIIKGRKKSSPQEADEMLKTLGKSAKMMKTQIGSRRNLDPAENVLFDIVESFLASDTEEYIWRFESIISASEELGAHLLKSDIIDPRVVAIGGLMMQPRIPSGQTAVRKVDGRKKPGRSPEEAMFVIAVSGHIQNALRDKGYFTIDDYRAGYNEVKEKYKGLVFFADLPEKKNDTQSVRDLDAIADPRDKWRVLKGPDERTQGKEVRYELSGQEFDDPVFLKLFFKSRIFDGSDLRNHLSGKESYLEFWADMIFGLGEGLSQLDHIFNDRANGDLEEELVEEVLGSIDRLKEQGKTEESNRVLGNLISYMKQNMEQGKWFTRQDVEEKQRLLDIRTMAGLAKQGGKEIPTRPIEQYTLLVPFGFYNGEKEFEEHQFKYGDRFTLDCVSGATSEKFVDNILAKAEENERTIALVPDSVSERDLARLVEKGIRVIVINSVTLADVQNQEKQQKETFLQNAYTIMLLARKITKDTKKDSRVYQLLEFYLRTHFDMDDVSVKDYIRAIASDSVDNIATLIKALLRAVPIAPYNIREEYNNIAETLLSA